MPASVMASYALGHGSMSIFRPGHARVSPSATRCRPPARCWPNCLICPTIQASKPMPNSDESHRRRSIYLLPNAFTTANLFAGFYAVVQAMNGRFEMAAIAIFLAMVFDGMDGRVARLTNTQSEIGRAHV